MSKATPRPPAGTQHTGEPQYTRVGLIREIVPHPSLDADFIALAAIFEHPDLIARHLGVLDASLWHREVHRYLARIGLVHVAQYGGVDLPQILHIIEAFGGLAPACIDIEVRTLRQVARLIDGLAIVAQAVNALRARTGRAA